MKGRIRRKCRYCGHEGFRLKPSMMVGTWQCRDREKCDARLRAKSPFTKG